MTEQMGTAAQVALMLALQSTPVPTPEQMDAMKMPKDGSPAFTPERVREAMAVQSARDLLAQTSLRGRLGRSVGFMVDDTADPEREFKTFVSTVEDVELHAPSQRVVVHLRGKPTKRAADGREKVRTDRLDRTPEARLMSRRARDLVGHRVVVKIEMEPMTDDSGQKVRVLRHLTDLGLATPADFGEQPVAQPEQQPA